MVVGCCIKALPLLVAGAAGVCSIIIGVIWNELDKKFKSPSGIAKSNIESMGSFCKCVAVW